MFQFSDFLVFIGWIWHNTMLIFQAILSPIKYIFYFLQNFTAQAFATPITPEYSWSFGSAEMGLFSSIPYWSVLMKVCLLALIIIIGFSILHTLHKT